MTVPTIAFRSGLLAPHIYGAPTDFRIELASSSIDAPLFLAAKGERIRWTPDRDEAEAFVTADAAWDHVFAERLPPVRVRS